ncbi:MULTISPECIES: PilZ domain-containing protein [Bradyrhizobium]|uniref:PilZ domain-containing protein n=1 Tax=Bradyrhizobium TaxID=374 RepID=UPI00360D431B
MPVERRRAVRKILEQSVSLSIPGEETSTHCTMKNLTVFGAGVCLPRVTILPTEFELSFDQFRTSFACRLVWQRDDCVGISFVW